MRESMESLSRAQKKPRVPKVSELLPNVVIVMPSKPAQSTERGEDNSYGAGKK